MSVNTPKQRIFEHDPFDDLVKSGGLPEAQHFYNSKVIDFDSDNNPEVIRDSV